MCKPRCTQETGKYDDDNSEMERLRQKRIAELKAKTAAEKFGDVCAN
jgi:hypothetical protein